MIPRTIHYCWFGPAEMPAEAQRCLASWREAMPGWTLRRWDERSFDVQSTLYTAQAYAAGKYAFVSDYVRLWALEREGGLYLDTDVLVFRPFDALLAHHAFAGFEGSKHLPVGTCVMASEAHGQWVREMLALYDGLPFLLPSGAADLTTNVQRLTAAMAANGLRQDGSEQDYLDLHVLPVDYFSPRLTTGQYRRTENTYSEHLALASWSTAARGPKVWLRRLVGQRVMTRLILIKRKLIG